MYEVDCKELKKLMIDHDISGNTELSRRSGVNRDTITKIFDGKVFPTSKVIINIANALSMDSEQIGSIFFKIKVT